MEFPDDTTDETIARVAKEQTAKLKATETTVADIGTGIKSGITTGAIGAIPAIPAFVADVGMLPAHIATAGD